MANTSTSTEQIVPKRSREALTWAILIVSFVGCMAVTLSIPLTAGWIVQNAERRLSVHGRGTLGKPSTTLGEVIEPEQAARRYRTPIGMLTGTDERGVFEITNPDSGRLAARLEILGDSNVEVQTAVMPRFGRSSETPQMLIALFEGRIRLTITENSDLDGQLVAFVNSPNGQVAIDKAGKYTLTYSDETMQVSVYEGRAYLRSETDELQLQPQERGVLAADLRTTGPFPTEIDLIENGDFSESYSGWRLQAPPPERADQPAASLEILDVNGENAARFLRDGGGNAQILLRQTIDRSVADFDDMRLNITMGVNNQSLDVCGFQGTECPMTVRIDFVDEDGQRRAWQQGFYVRGDIGETAPNTCEICGFPLSLSIHSRLPQMGEIFAQDGQSNLMQFLAQEGVRPDHIEAISLKAEGHSFAVDVFGVELIVSEDVEQNSADS